MTAPFIFVLTLRVDPERRDQFDDVSRQLTEFIEQNEPDTLAYFAYESDEGDEITYIQMHRDAAAADRHLQAAHPIIEPAFEMTEFARIDVYGRPGEFFDQALSRNAERGVEVNRKPAALDGFARV